MARVALVTGGSRGIGAAISKALKAAGHTVAANYAGNDEAANKFKAETGIPVYKWSVADYEACAAGIKQVEADLGPLDILVNNAGITRDAMFHRMTPRPVARGDRHQPQRRLQHDAPGLERHARAQVRPRHHHLLDQRPERPGRPGELFCLEGRRHRLHKALAQEGSRAGITVNVIAPGYIGTEMVRAIDPEVLKTKIIPQIPVGRLGTPEEIGRAVVFLASDEGGFITGSTLSINGGQYMA